MALKGRSTVEDRSTRQRGKRKEAGGGRSERGREMRDESGLERKRVEAGQQHHKNSEEQKIKREGEESGEASRPNGAKVKLCLAPGQNATGHVIWTQHSIDS